MNEVVIEELMNKAKQVESGYLISQKRSEDAIMRRHYELMLKLEDYNEQFTSFRDDACEGYSDVKAVKEYLHANNIDTILAICDVITLFCNDGDSVLYGGEGIRIIKARGEFDDFFAPVN